jgi:hypothetical protein
MIWSNEIRHLTREDWKVLGWMLFYAACLAVGALIGASGYGVQYVPDAQVERTAQYDPPAHRVKR